MTMKKAIISCSYDMNGYKRLTALFDKSFFILYRLIVCKKKRKKKKRKETTCQFLLFVEQSILFVFAEWDTSIIIQAIVMTSEVRVTLVYSYHGLIKSLSLSSKHKHIISNFKHPLHILKV